jgi:hypothetical protein
MNAIKQVRRYLVKNPGSPSSKVLARLTAAVAEETSFPLGDLYRLDGEAFDLAMELLRDWRLNRYYAARIKLFDAVLAEVGDEVGTSERAG